jgi:O-methyltransferase
MYHDNSLEQCSESTMNTPIKLYLDLMKQCLTNSIYGKYELPPYDERARIEGRDLPPTAHTMIGIKCLDNLQFCVEDVLANDVPGDLIETGVWRGGATIFMRAILKAYGVNDRTVWAADSFKGLPAPDPDKYPQDVACLHALQGDYHLQVPLSEVRANFATYGLLDEQVRFLEGWFRDTLPTAPIKQLAVLRLDGDLYESTMDALRSLYPKLSVGGYVIVDDYGAINECQQAVQDFRESEYLTDTLHWIDSTGVYWQRSR